MGIALAVLLISALMGFVTEVRCTTNGELYDLLTEHSDVFQEKNIDPTVFETEVPVNDTAITLPGGPHDERAIHQLVKDSRICTCVKNTCHCCVKHTYSVNLWITHVHIKFHPCVRMTYNPAKHIFYIHVWFNGRSLYNNHINVQHPPRLCYKVPGQTFSKACLQLFHVNKEHRSLCVRVKGWIRVVVKVFHINLDICCLKLPRSDDQTLDVTDHWTLDEGTRDHSNMFTQTSDEEIAHALKLDDNRSTDMVNVFRSLQESD